MAINTGFMGLAKIIVTGMTPEASYTYYFRFNDCSINLEQDLQFYDHTIGLVDTLETASTTITTKGEQAVTASATPYTLNYQKSFWRPGVKIIRGSISFPATLSIFSAFFDLAKYGRYFSINVAYHCGLNRTYSTCRVNSLSISITAGDILNMTMDVVGSSLVDGTTAMTNSGIQKLITWDAVNVAATNIFSTDSVHAFEMTINNNCIPIYTSGYNTTGSLFPKEIRIGMQEVTGTVTFFNRATAGNPLSDTTTTDTITLDVCTGSTGAFTKAMTVVYKPIQRASAITVPLQTLGFIGVDRPLGL